MQTIQERINSALKAKAKSIVEEQILMHTLDEVAEYAGDIMGKMSLDTKNEKEIQRIHDGLYAGLIKETIKQLKEALKK